MDPFARLAQLLTAAMTVAGPRHLARMVQVTAPALVGGGIVEVVFALSVPGPPSLTLFVLLPALFVLTALGLRVLPAPFPALLCILGPVVAALSITMLDLATRDASAAGQVFFCVPVLFAASQLRPLGAALVTACALVGDAVVALSLLPTERALADLVHVGLALVLTATLIAREEVLQERLVSRLRSQADIDPMTGLVTRRVLDEAVQGVMSGARDHIGAALVLVDVDRFKSVNDTLGHVVGDDVLAYIAALLRVGSRPHDVLARMGGDELAVLMPGCSYAVALARAQDLVHAVRDAPLRLADGSPLALSISAGVAHAPEHAGQVRELYAAADDALYRAKRGGRGRVGRVSRPAVPHAALEGSV